MEIPIFMNFVFISGLFMSLSYLLYRDRKKQNQSQKEAQAIADAVNNKAAEPVIITLKREMIALDGMEQSFPSQDLSSFGFKVSEIHACQKTELSKGLSSQVKELLNECIKNGLTRGSDVVSLLNDSIPEKLSSNNLYVILYGDNPLTAKIYAYVSKY